MEIVADAMKKNSIERNILFFIYIYITFCAIVPYILRAILHYIYHILFVHLFYIEHTLFFFCCPL